MEHVIVSNKYQVVIPRRVREKLNIRKGQRMAVLALGKRIELIPDVDLAEMEGAFPGLSIDGIREETDRF